MELTIKDILNQVASVKGGYKPSYVLISKSNYKRMFPFIKTTRMVNRLTKRSMIDIKPCLWS